MAFITLAWCSLFLDEEGNSKRANSACIEGFFIFAAGLAIPEGLTDGVLRVPLTLTEAPLDLGSGLALLFSVERCSNGEQF